VEGSCFPAEKPLGGESVKAKCWMMFLLLCSGCSVYKAATQPGPANLKGQGLAAFAKEWRAGVLDEEPDLEKAEPVQCGCEPH
jgi:hypothetical protein